MATAIQPISMYTLKNDVLVLQNNIKHIFLKYIFAIALICIAFIPMTLGDSYLEYTPLKEGVRQEKLVSKIQEINPSVSDDEAQSIITSAFKWALEFKVAPSLVLGIIATESTFAKHAISNAGAFGLMQVLPKWHLEKVKEARAKTGTPELFNIDTNIYLGTRIYKECKTKYSSAEKALLCYNGSIGTNSSYASKVLQNKRVFDEYI